MIIIITYITIKLTMLLIQYIGWYQISSTKRNTAALVTVPYSMNHIIIIKYLPYLRP